MKVSISTFLKYYNICENSVLKILKFFKFKSTEMILDDSFTLYRTTFYLFPLLVEASQSKRER